MPGLSFVFDFHGRIPEKRGTVVRALEGVLHLAGYKFTILSETNFYLIGFTHYDEYPLKCFENATFQIWLEGEIYGKDSPALHIELNVLASNVFSYSCAAEQQITDWLRDADGDFVIIIRHKESGEIAIISDILGRLPLYATDSDGEFIVSREIRFITALREHTFDMMGIAQFLLFRHSIGDRTFLANVRHVRPTSIIRTSLNPPSVKAAHFECLSFDSKSNQSRSMSQNADELASLFSLACINRSRVTDLNVLALSGGLDSRAVAAALNLYGIPFCGRTHVMNGMIGQEMKIAEQVARAFKIEWSPIAVESKGRDFIKLLRMKGGLNYLGMAFIVPFLAEIRETLGAGVAYWTGDGGNRLQMDHRPTGNVNTLEALANYIIRNHQVLPLSTVAALTGVDEREMQQAVEELLASFPEKEVDQKYMRFHILEKMGRWNFEGEDRNRIYFWSVAPFLSVQFFRYLMNCPEEQKKRHALYKAFFKKLSTDAMQIDNANWGFSLNSKKYLFMMLLRTCVLDRISAALKTKIKAKLRGSDTDQYRSILQLQLGGCDLIKDHIAPEALASAIKNCSQKELATLVTITSVIEELECGRSSFEQFYNTNLFVVGNNDSSPPSRASLLVD